MDPFDFTGMNPALVGIQQEMTWLAAGIKVPSDANAVTREAFTLAARWRLLADRMAAA